MASVYYCEEIINYILLLSSGQLWRKVFHFAFLPRAPWEPQRNSGDDTSHEKSL